MSGTGSVPPQTSPTLVPVSVAPVTTPAPLDDARKKLAYGLTAAVLGIFSVIAGCVLFNGFTVDDAKELVTGVFLPIFGVIGPIIAFFFARPT